MVPASFETYFMTSAGAAAALVGLLFVAVSLAPERTVMRSAPVERRVVALSAYGALLNAFFLSMAALLPRTNLGTAAVPLSVIGLANQGLLAWDLYQHAQRTWLSVLRGGTLILAGVLLYGGELYNAILLLRSPANSGPVSTLAALLLGIYALGLTRAWQLLGGRGHGLGEWLSPLHEADDRTSMPAAGPTSSGGAEPSAQTLPPRQ